MKIGSLFSGCGGMDLGLDQSGLGSLAWQVEFNPRAAAVLARHWPTVPRFADVREVPTDALAAVSLIAGGSPCQDLSVAGKRAGLDGERSGLFHHFVRIADSQPSAWILWENVDGALSSNNGEDFAIVLGELSGYRPGVPVDGWRSSGFGVGPKRWLVWRVLDSQHFGVPQRRKRLFVVGGPRDGVHCPEVLLEPDCLRGDSKEGRGSREGVAGTVTQGFGARRGAGLKDGMAGGLYAIQDCREMEKAQGGLGISEAGVSCTLDSTGAQGIAHALSTRPGQRMDPNGETYVIKGAAIGREPENGPQYGEVTEGPCFTLNCTEVHAVVHTLRASYDASEDGTGRGTPIIAAPLTSKPWADNEAQESKLIPYHLAQITSPENRANPQPGDPAPSLNGDARLAIVGAMSSAGATAKKHGHGWGQQDWEAGYCQPTSRGVRRLTERECERLQGMPDDWTRWAADGSEISSGARYKMIGNAVTVNVARWIGGRLRRFMPHPAAALNYLSHLPGSSHRPALLVGDPRHQPQ